ncbi:MAG: DNA polymerase III subunit delta [Lachnospiraceae bacterium]|nr:DNA polymerase III subunit delta [Lachnospiraceae bacterium]
MANFADIIGHEDIIQHFKMSIERNMVSHAYIINGEKGSGKKTLTKVIAKTLECESGDPDACDNCHSCKQADSGNHPDIKWITHDKPNLISIDEVREQINDDIIKKPYTDGEYTSRYKIYIVNDAHLLNPQAQNALLKTIEEPPEYAIIFLLTNNLDKLLPTIVSRCVVLNMKPVREMDVINYLTTVLNVPEEQAYFSERFAFGNLGKAVRLATSENYKEIRDTTVRLLRQIYNMETEDILAVAKRLSDYRLDMQDLMDIMQMWYRDILMFKITNSPNQLVFKDEYTAMKKQSAHISYEGIDNVIKALDKMKLRLEANVNFDVAMELLLMTIKENYNG